MPLFRFIRTSPSSFNFTVTIQCHKPWAKQRSNITNSPQGNNTPTSTPPIRLLLKVPLRYESLPQNASRHLPPLP